MCSSFIYYVRVAWMHSAVVDYGTGPCWFGLLQFLCVLFSSSTDAQHNDVIGCRSLVQWEMISLCILYFFFPFECHGCTVLSLTVGPYCFGVCLFIMYSFSCRVAQMYCRVAQMYVWTCRSVLPGFFGVVFVCVLCTFCFFVRCRCRVLS